MGWLAMIRMMLVVDAVVYIPLRKVIAIVSAFGFNIIDYDLA